MKEIEGSPQDGQQTVDTQGLGPSQSPRASQALLGAPDGSSQEQTPTYLPASATDLNRCCHHHLFLSFS